MNRFVLALTKVAVLCSGVGLSGAALAQDAQNQLNPVNPAKEEVPLNLTSAQPTRGVVFFTATINSNGTVAACFGCNVANTLRLGTGQYQIDFGQNVQAVNGWSRWVQADPL